MIEKEEIRREAEKVLKELSAALGEVDLEETYYVVDEINVTRPDGAPSVDKKFLKILKKNAIHMDEEGNYIMEIGKWVK
ncbi:MAG: Asp-tRNA(Asn) amidotransferase GatCAB subunit C [Nitrososphaeria archaeon]|nr:Asp-tRNA(Asn) amidotransferase GatCAB subunit C [Nitrososphaeria archaeon]